jgi:hypothetical protein
VLELVSPEFRPFLGVGGLVLVSVAFVGLVQRYQDWQRRRLVRSRRLLGGAELLERARRDLGSRPLPEPVARFFRDELLARYRLLHGMFPRLEGLESHRRAAETGFRPGEGAGEDMGVDQLATYVSALEVLLTFLATHRPVTGGGREHARALREALRSLQANAQARRCRRLTRDAAAAGDWLQARSAAWALVEWLRDNPSGTADADELCRWAMELYRRVSCQELPADMLPGGAEADAGERTRA